MLKTIFYESSDQTKKQYDNNNNYEKSNENIQNSYHSPHQNQDSLIEGSRDFINDF